LVQIETIGEKAMKKIKAFTLIEMLVVVAIIALLIAILLPSLSKARELARQTICGTNMKEIGTTFYIYQSDNLDEFPTVAHDTPPDQTTPEIEYIGNMGGGLGGAPEDPKRDEISESRTDNTEGSTRISTTRSLWLLVRTGEVIPKQFVCPSADDSVDPTVDVTTYFDFIGYNACSYGYQIPYDNTNTCRPSADADPRMAIAADRGPWSSADPEELGRWTGGSAPSGFNIDTIDDDVASVLYPLLTDPNENLTEDSTPDKWKRFNSPNHGGQGQGAGQSVLYPDAHAEFKKTPLGGVDSDNIYTQMASTGDWTGDDFRRGLQWGLRPELSGSTPVYPGDGSLNPAQTIDSLTDSLIWP
jgi:prepilin-type N-terminal cleavage/methylation domain-containing protein